jgi:hypothetical protein
LAATSTFFWRMNLPVVRAAGQSSTVLLEPPQRTRRQHVVEAVLGKLVHDVSAPSECKTTCGRTGLVLKTWAWRASKDPFI